MDLLVQEEEGSIDGSGTANDLVMWSDSDTLTDAPIAISGNNATFAGDITVSSGAIDLGSGSSSIKKTAGGTNGNHAAIELYSSGTSDSGSAIAIQQQTSEGDSIIFADYEPHVEWGISTENNNNEIQFTAGNTTGNMGSKTLYNNLVVLELLIRK